MSLSQNKSSIPINITTTTSSGSPLSNSVSPTPQTSASSSFKNVLFQELQVTISSAKLTSKESSPDKYPGGVYVELYVDNSSVFKTECLKSTYSPKWDIQFPVLITPYSKLTFKVFCRCPHSTKDNLLGDNSVHLYDTLKRLNGKIDNLSMPLILDKVKNLDTNDQELATSTSLLNIGDQRSKDDDELLVDVSKPNYLFIKLTGLEVDMSQYPSKSRSTSPNVNASTVDGQDKNKTKSNHEKHSTRSLPRLFRGKHSNSSNSSSSTATSSSPVNSTSTATTENTSEQQTDNLTSNGFQSTLPRWSLNDPNNNNSNNLPYPRQQSNAQTSNNNNSTTVQYTTPGGQYPFQSNQAQTTFTITNNSNQVQPATITTTEYEDVLPQGL